VLESYRLRNGKQTKPCRFIQAQDWSKKEKLLGAQTGTGMVSKRKAVRLIQVQEW